MARPGHLDRLADGVGAAGAACGRRTARRSRAASRWLIANAAPRRRLGRGPVHGHRLPRRLLHQLRDVPARVPDQRARALPPGAPRSRREPHPRGDGAADRARRAAPPRRRRHARAHRHGPGPGGPAAPRGGPGPTAGRGHRGAGRWSGTRRATRRGGRRHRGPRRRGEPGPAGRRGARRAPRATRGIRSASARSSRRRASSAAPPSVPRWRPPGRSPSTWSPRRWPGTLGARVPVAVVRIVVDTPTTRPVASGHDPRRHRRAAAPTGDRPDHRRLGRSRRRLITDSRPIAGDQAPRARGPLGCGYAVRW